MDENVSVPLSSSGQNADKPLICGRDEPDEPPPKHKRNINTYKDHLYAKQAGAWSLFNLFANYVAIEGLDISKVGNLTRLMGHHYCLQDITVRQSWAASASGSSPSALSPSK